MKSKERKTVKPTLSDKIADALTVKPRADIEDDQVFGTKPQTVSRADFSSSDSEVDATISDFRKRSVNLLSEISKKYEGQVVSREEHKKNEVEDDYEDSDSDADHNLLSVQDLVLDADSADTNDEGTIYKPTTPKTKLDNKVKQKNNTLAETSLNFNGSTEKYKSPSKSIKKSLTIKNIGDDSKINRILKSIGAFSSEQATVSKTDSESENSLVNKSDDQSKRKIEKKVNITFEKQKESISSDIEEHSSHDDESDDYSINQKEDQSDDEEEESDNAEESGNEEDEGFDISQMDAPVLEQFEHVKKQNVSEEAKKGACVRNQLLIWEGLLEMRIHLQRCMNTANQMPLPEAHGDLKNNDEFSEECNVTKANVTAVIDKFLTLQNLLLKNNPETKSLCDSKKQLEESKDSSKKEDDEEIPSDTEDEEIPSDTDAEDDTATENVTPIQEKTVTRKRKLQDYETELSKSHKSFKMFRDATIQKWNDKTRLATATNIKNAPTNTILQQISYILSDREKLVRRTQLKRSEYDIIGYQPKINNDKEQETTDFPSTKDRKDADEYIPEIFDDSDFYHQLLRELIECKSADISDPVQLSRQWIALQQMRSKMKRKVDTKATKGRKIKYVVHNKLVNYMAPEKFTSWTDESTNELYSSLFGKLFEGNNVGLNANLENGFKIKN